MYGYFYPENGAPYLESLRFDSVAEAAEWWRDKRSHWMQIEAGGDDKATFMQPRIGEMVVVRELSKVDTTARKGEPS